MITKPGIYTDFPERDYYADPCPAPSLTQSVAKILLDQSPLHAWHAHPRLNPDYHADDDTKFDVGNIAHKLMIGRGKDLVVLDFDDWRTKEARAKREEAAAEGKLAVLGKKFALADRMVKAAFEQLAHRNLGHLFVEGNGEVVLAWQEDSAWMRQMVDWLTPDRLTFVDYKTAGMSVAPHVLARKMADDGWPIQAAMAERGLKVLAPTTIARRYLFVVQETERPYCLNVVEVTRDPLMIGSKMLDHAADIWLDCLRTNRWPGYPLEIVKPEYPAWAEQQWLDREIAAAARARVPQQRGPVPDNLIMAG